MKIRLGFRIADSVLAERFWTVGVITFNSELRAVHVHSLVNGSYSPEDLMGETLESVVQRTQQDRCGEHPEVYFELFDTDRKAFRDFWTYSDMMRYAQLKGNFVTSLLNAS